MASIATDRGRVSPDRNQRCASYRKLDQVREDALMQPVFSPSARLTLPAQAVDATPSNTLIRQGFPGRSNLFGCPRSKPSQGSVPADLTLASDLAFVFNASRVRLECCIDLLRPPRLPEKWIFQVSDYPTYQELVTYRRARRVEDNFRVADHLGVGTTVVCVSAVCQSRAGRWHSYPLRAVKRI